MNLLIKNCLPNSFHSNLFRKNINIKNGRKYKNMRVTWNTEKAKKYAESRNYILLGEYIQFKKGKVKLQHNCPTCNYNIFYIGWNRFCYEKVGCSNCFDRKIYFKNYLLKLGYKILDGEYKNAHTEINIIDTLGYKYFISPMTILRGSHPEFVSKINPYVVENICRWIENNNKNIEFLSKKYCGGNYKLDWKCLTCLNIFQASWANVSSGKGCKYCQQSKGENRIQIFLKNNKYNFISQYRIVNCRDKKPLPFDFAILDGKDLKLIEYQGKLHTESREHFGGIEYLIDRIKKDKIKCDYCIENNIPLIIIDYKDFDNIEKILEDALQTSSRKEV